MDLTLWNIEADLANLIELREEMDSAGEDVTALDQQIREYCEREIRKVDGIRAYLKHAEMMAGAAKAEAEQQSARAKAWQARIDRLKEFCRATMDAWGSKRLDGVTGSLILKGNGGRRGVEITDASLIPEELCQYTGTIGGVAWGILKEVSDAYPDSGLHFESWSGRADVRMERIPHKSRIGAELEEPCERCGGNGVVEAWGDPGGEGEGGPGDNPCKDCGGSGKRGVPGARLVERGNHIEIR